MLDWFCRERPGLDTIRAEAKFILTMLPVAALFINFRRKTYIMPSKAEIKKIRSLYLKKYRQSEGLFIAEGRKTVGELLPAFECCALYATESYVPPCGIEAERVSYDELCRMSNMECPQDVLAVLRIPERELNASGLCGHLCIAADGVQDAGNLGTMIRIADWFGIEDFICSHDTVDAYNPKTVQASAGALARVRVHYCDLPKVLKDVSENGCPVYATALDGDNLYDCSFSDRGVVVFGNEGNGISKAVFETATHKLLIPNYPQGRLSTESLNVGAAAAVTLAEIRRQNLVYGV